MINPPSPVPPTIPVDYLPPVPLPVTPIIQPISSPITEPPVMLPYGLPNLTMPTVQILPSINPITLTTSQSYSAVPGGSAVINTALALAQQQQASGINPTFTYDQFGNAYDAMGNRIDIT